MAILVKMNNLTLTVSYIKVKVISGEFKMLVNHEHYSTKFSKIQYFDLVSQGNFKFKARFCLVPYEVFPSLKTMHLLIKKLLSIITKFKETKAVIDSDKYPRMG